MSSMSPITTLFEAAEAASTAKSAQAAPASSNNRLDVVINLSSRLGAKPMSHRTRTPAHGRILLAALPQGNTRLLAALGLIDIATWAWPDGRSVPIRRDEGKGVEAKARGSG